MRRTSRIPRVAVLAALAALALLPTATAQAGGGLSTNSSPTVAGSKAKLVKGKAIAPADAPRRVQKVIAAANRIRNKPYVWGGGHGNWKDKGYDCSGAVSYALHGGGLLNTPLDSTGLSRYGTEGQGLVDQRLREPEPRLHDRRRPPVRHLDDAGQRPRLEQDQALHARELQGPPPARPVGRRTAPAGRDQERRCEGRSGPPRGGLRRFGIRPPDRRVRQTPDSLR